MSPDEIRAKRLARMGGGGSAEASKKGKKEDEGESDNNMERSMELDDNDGGVTPMELEMGAEDESSAPESSKVSLIVVSMLQ